MSWRNFLTFMLTFLLQHDVGRAVRADCAGATVAPRLRALFRLPRTAQ